METSLLVIALLFLVVIFIIIVLVAAHSIKEGDASVRVVLASLCMVLFGSVAVGIGDDAFGEGQAEDQLKVGTYKVSACARYTDKRYGDVHDCIVVRKGGDRIRYLIPAKLFYVVDGVFGGPYNPGTVLEIYEMDDGLHVRARLPKN